MKHIINILLVANIFAAFGQAPAVKRIGIIGLDTSHATTFAAMFNGEKANPDFADFRVTAAYPWGSKTIREGYSRVPMFTENAKALGIRIVDSIDELLQEVDVVMLETQDGNLRVEQALAVFKAGKPVFLDKPMAASLADICLIFELAALYNTPTFTSSSFRYIAPVLEVVSGKKGRVLGADCFGPCHEEASHPAMYWYGMHTVEMLFSVMGTGCKSVTHTHTNDTDLAVGTWDDDRIGIFRGMRRGSQQYYHFGGFAFCEKGPVKLDSYSDFGYPGLMKEMVHFFRTGEIPVTHEMTIEIYAFMDASTLSYQTSKPVVLDEVIQRARETAKKELIKYNKK
jgi:hypothetical protein